LKQIAAQADIDLRVIFLCDISTKAYQDSGFGKNIKWDTPLLDGYEHYFADSSIKQSDFGYNNPSVKLKSIRENLDKHSWDAIWVHGYGNIGLLYAIYYSLKNAIPLMFRADSTLSNRKSGFLKTCFSRWLFKRCAALLYVGSNNRDYYVHYGANADSLFSMPYAIDNDFFRRTTKTIARPRDKRIILFASKFAPGKNPLMLTKAFNKLPIKIRNSAQLWLIGDGEENQKIQDYLKKHDLAESVILLGFKNQSELPNFFHACDVFVLPAEREAFGLVINEVMNQAKPIITTDQVGAARDIVKQGENGWVIEAGSEQALSLALKSALTLETSELTAMGKRSLEIISDWSFEKDIEGLRGALYSICKMPR